MNDVSLVLGPVTFCSFEVPPSINFGGRHILATHQLADGRRVIDAIGPAESEIRFSGVFSGPTSTARAHLLNSLRLSGTRVPLSWDTLYYTVILSGFDAQYDNPAWIPYRISCTVVRDEAVSPDTIQPSATELISSDLTMASLQSAGSGVDFTALQASTAVSDADSLYSASYANALCAFATTQAQISSKRNQVESEVRSSQAFDAASATTLISGLPLLATASGQLASLCSANGFFGRAYRNFTEEAS